jgi:hypothetical protein
VCAALANVTLQEASFAWHNVLHADRLNANVWTNATSHIFSLQKIDEWLAVWKENASSKYRGVTKHRNTFRACAVHPLTGKQQVTLFNSSQEICAQAYDKQMLKWWGR